MLWTLHRYILRELLRNFLLASLVLVIVVTMGGGVANLVRAQGLDALDMIRLFIYFSPVAATFVVPVSAMYAAAITLGRMSADNELTACRAAGVNVMRLFSGVAGLGGVVCAFTFYSWNFLIPTFFIAAESITQADVARLVAARLAKTKSFEYSGVALHADVVEALTDDPQRPGLQHLRLGRVVMLRLDRTSVQSYGTARVADIHFDRSATPPEIRADLYDVRSYDANRAQYAEAAHQPLGPQVLPTTVRERISFQSLTTLLPYLRDPTTMRAIDARIRQVRWAAMQMLSYDRIEQAIAERPNVCTLRGSDGSALELTATGLRRGVKDGEIGLREPTATVRGADGGVTRYTAQSGRAMIRDGMAAPDETFVDIELEVVEQGPAGAAEGDPRRVRRAAARLTGYHIPEAAIADAGAISAADIVDGDAPVRLAARMQENRKALVKDFRIERARLFTVLHYRGALAVSAIGTVLLAAMLGAIFRGGQVLTAFGVSCVPGLFVVLAILAGRNLGEDPNYHPFGIGMIWGVIVLLSAVTVYTAWKQLPR